ncbi:M23 family metallopeptidase [Gracilibacillus sp. YIM 98692]|uniref:M23 family metallopeptidase n=1 Tax=Gracilibacillus sp. YIM 98692 TaxID=2663532 RepID=UPI0013D21534|nr:M23 family metallopeptidase [Gracilibacillus sp. YIM 98692]
MRKNLAQIRKNIHRRKQERKQATEKLMSQSTDKSFIKNVMMEDEERHGYSPPVHGWGGSSQNSSTSKPFLFKSVLASAIFFVSVLTMSIDSKWMEKPRQWTSYAITEEFPFATVNAWYQAKFGAPFAIQTDLEKEEEVEPTALPVSGQISQSFQENGEGIRISSSQETEVVAVEAGTVLFAGNDRHMGKTVIVQHADRSKSIYGFLSDIEVYSYQTIQENQPIGTYIPDENQQSMYFAIEKNRQFIDPIRVMQVDEQP